MPAEMQHLNLSYVDAEYSVCQITRCHNILYKSFHCYLHENLKFHMRCCCLSFGDLNLVYLNNNENLMVVVETCATA